MESGVYGFQPLNEERIGPVSHTLLFQGLGIAVNLEECVACIIILVSCLGIYGGLTVKFDKAELYILLLLVFHRNDTLGQRGAGTVAAHDGNVFIMVVLQPFDILNT